MFYTCTNIVFIEGRVTITITIILFATHLLRPRHTMRRNYRCDISRRQVGSSALLLRQDKSLILSLRYVTQIQTILNSCDRSQRQNSVAATMIFICHTRRFVAACVSAFTTAGLEKSTSPTPGASENFCLASE